MSEVRKTLPPEAGDRCSHCSRFYEHRDLRPYGDDGAPICFNCALIRSRRAATIRHMVEKSGAGYTEPVKETVAAILNVILPNTDQEERN